MSELILLNDNGHEQESPSSEEISTWLSTYMSFDFDCRDILSKQLHNTSYTLSTGPGYISIMFNVDPCRERFRVKHGVPVNMYAFHEDKEPIGFLLHVADGVVVEFELYSLDSSLIDYKVSVENVKFKVVDVVPCTYNVYDL